MESLQIVGISGKAGSGKDWIAQNLLIPRGFRQWSFAWHFKVWLVGQGKATLEEVFETKPPHIRKLMQEEGTERGRMVYGEDIWANTMYAWFQTINMYWGENKFVVPDVRFVNEVEAIHRLGGKVYRIYAPIRVANSSLSEEARNHISETALDGYKKFDGYIDNDPQYANTVETQIINLLNR